MSNDWDWPGSRWWRFDFHTHTPASSDYLKGNKELQDQVDSATWLLTFMAAGIDCVAVTDHNSGAWIDRLKQELERLEQRKHPDYHPLYLFPGVELSVNGGIHILAILDTDKTTSDIDSLLGAVGFHGTKGDSDACTESSLTNVIQAIARAGGIAIPAHVDGPKGLLELQVESQTQARLDAKTLEQILKSPHIVAMEVCDPSIPKPQVYNEAKINWTEIVGSDSHNLRQGSKPGSASTWIKMGKPSLEGLWLALLDGKLSVHRSDQTTDDPNAHGHFAIDELRIKNARYLGRPTAFTCRFNPWVNAIVGSRGTGKSTLVEFLRLTLRRDKELPDSLVADFKKYSDTNASRQDEGLLLTNTRLIVEYRKDGGYFRAQWSADGAANALEEQTADGWQTAPGEITQRLPVRIYSQKQIFELAKQPSALLQVIDYAEEVHYREWRQHWDELSNHYLALRAQYRQAASGLAEQSRITGELSDVKRKLALFEQADHAEILKTYQRTQQQRRALERWEEGWQTAGKHLRGWTEQLTPTELETQPFNLADAQDAIVIADTQAFAARFAALLQRLQAVAHDADQLVEEWRDIKQGATWFQAMEVAQTQYASLQNELAQAGVGDPGEYGRLVQRQQTLQDQLDRLEARSKTLTSLEAEATKCLQQLQCHRRELTRQRNGFLRAVLNDNRYVRIAVIPYGDRDSVEGNVRQLLDRQQGGFGKDLGLVNGEQGLLAELYQNYDPQKSDTFETDLTKFKHTLASIRQNQSDAVRDKRFINHLQALPPERFDRLDCWFPEDALQVSYSDGQSSSFRPVAQGSPGQKTAALLAFLLSYGDEPLILDQPEDDLDNHLIYDLIVTQLRQIKHRRQVIVVTHNANIVVNGDVELVTALEVKHGQTNIAAQGSLQEASIRNEICRVMEGGREAFERRYQRIMRSGHHV
jgi:ABC-type lipoprotein export system ATPase subunit/histidinol phosphatase-like PHP family hydrolase